MTKSFDYEEVFMGLSTDSSVTPQKIFNDDYRVRFLVEEGNFKKGRILDIGCGGGTLTESLTHFFPKAEVFGCDISKTAIKMAKKYGKGKVNYAVNDESLPYKENYFDLVLCLDVLEHIPDIHHFLKEVKRVLKKNGLFYLVVPCEDQPFTLYSFFQKIKIGDKLSQKHLGHIHPEFTHQYIDKLLTDYKFVLVEKRYQDHLLSQIILFFQYFLSKELLELLLGKKKAEKYYDRSLIIKAETKQSKKNDPIIFLRNVWAKASDLAKIISRCETRLLNRVGFTASKLFVLTRKS